MTALPEKLPCPFCGSPHPKYQLGWGVRCTACDASVPCRGDDYSPWNRRAILDTPEALAASPEVKKLVAEAEARGMERAAGIAKRFYEKALHRADAARKDGAADDELEATASAYGSLEHSIRAEAAAIRRATEETAT